MGEAVVSVYQVTWSSVGTERVLQWLHDWTHQALKYANGEMEVEDLLKGFEEGRIQIWAVLEDGRLVGVATTQVVDFPRIAILRVVTLQGKNLNVWMEALLHALEQFCREQGLQRIEVVGRRGWVRKLAGLGFREVYSVVVKEVGGNVQKRRDNEDGIVH